MTEFNTVWFPLQYECNNRCSWCYAPSEITSSKEKRFDDKKENEFIDLIDDLNVKKVILIGGEPSIYSNLERVIERISKKGIRASMVTNGRKLSDYDFVQKVGDAGLTSLTVSIEGSSPEIHDSITRISGSFYETLQGIDNSIKYGFPTCTETTMCNENEGDLENIVSLLEERDLSHRLFNICGPCVSNLDDSTYTIPLSKGAKLFERVYESAKRKNVRLVTPVPVCNLNQEMYKDMKKNKAISHGCHILFGTNFVLDANGDILPCVHFSNYPIFNVYEEGKVMSSERFRDLWENPKEANQQFRKVLRRYPSQKCSEGDCWNPCTGGCSVFWLKYNPEEEIRDLKQNV
ncbi:MAG: radical SAM protein [Patescibacteria group bacterium]|nr:radical SAM protein [Patescibacteria group bacterium]